MPIVTMPDGVDVELPDTLTPELATRLKNLQKNQIPQNAPAVKQPEGYNLIGLGEAALNLGTGMASSAAGGLVGLGKLATGASPEEATKAIQDIQQAGTYTPRTEGGGMAAYLATLPIDIATKYATKAGTTIGQALGNENLGQTVGEVAVPTVATALMGTTPVKSIATTKFTPPAAPRIPVVSGIADIVTKSGKEKLASDYLKTLTTPEEAIKITSALDRRSGEVVPGSPVTSADAIARANRELALKGVPDRFGGQFVALQEGLSKIPETSSQLNTIRAIQEQARAGVLKEGAGNDPLYSRAQQIRSENASQNYGAFEKIVIQSEDTLSKLLETPAMQSAVRVAERIAANEQRPFSLGKDTPATTKVTASVDPVTGAPILNETAIPAEFAKYPLSSLQDIKMALDKMVAKPESFSEFGINAADLHALRGVRSQLVDWLNTKSSLYEKANTQYAIDSVPLNQMDLWRVLKDKFISPTGKEAPGSYLKALRDETKLIKDAIGYQGKTGIDKIFNTKDSALAARLAAEMEMELFKQRMAGEINIPGIGRSAEGMEPKIPQLLWRPGMVANFVLRHLAKGANVDVNIAAARILADPKLLSGVLKQFKQPKRDGILKEIRKAAISKESAGLSVISPQTDRDTPIQELPVTQEDILQDVPQMKPVGGKLLTEADMKQSFGNPESPEEDLMQEEFNRRVFGQ